MFMAKAVVKRIKPRARANPHLPAAISLPMAVVKVRVLHRMFPPTIWIAPISEIAAPKAAMNAATISVRTSRICNHINCNGVAPNVIAASLTLGSMFETALAESPIIIGKARISCAIIIAVSVNRR